MIETFGQGRRYSKVPQRVRVVNYGREEDVHTVSRRVDGRTVDERGCRHGRIEWTFMVSGSRFSEPRRVGVWFVLVLSVLKPRSVRRQTQDWVGK